MCHAKFSDIILDDDLERVSDLLTILRPDKETIMSIRISLILVFLSLGVASGAERPESQTLVQKEMVALDAAFKSTIDAIVMNEPEKIPPAFEEVASLREQVEHAVKSGIKLTLPRNQKRFKEFVRLDDKFHHELEILLKAARKKNMTTVRKQTHRLLDLCARCHTVFKK